MQRQLLILSRMFNSLWLVADQNESFEPVETQARVVKSDKLSKHLEDPSDDGDDLQETRTEQKPEENEELKQQLADIEAQMKNLIAQMKWNAYYYWIIFLIKMFGCNKSIKRWH